MRLLPRTSADKMAMFTATVLYVFVSCSVATISKMMAHDPLTDPPGLVGTQAVRENCDGSHLNLSTEGTLRLSTLGPALVRRRIHWIRRRPQRSQLLQELQGKAKRIRWEQLCLVVLLQA